MGLKSSSGSDVKCLALIPEDRRDPLCPIKWTVTLNQHLALRRSGSAPGGSDRGDRWHRLCPCRHLFAALNVLDGTVIGRNMQRHRHQEFMRFLNAIEADKTRMGGLRPRRMRLALA